MDIEPEPDEDLAFEDDQAFEDRLAQTLDKIAKRLNAEARRAAFLADQWRKVARTQQDQHGSKLHDHEPARSAEL